MFSLLYWDLIGAKITDIVLLVIEYLDFIMVMGTQLVLIPIVTFMGVIIMFLALGFVHKQTTNQKTKTKLSGGFFFFFF